MRNKLMLLLSALMVAMLVLAACGGGSPTPTPAPAAAPTEAATEAPTEATARPKRANRDRSSGRRDRSRLATEAARSATVEATAATTDTAAAAAPAAGGPALTIWADEVALPSWRRSHRDSRTNMASTSRLSRRVLAICAMTSRLPRPPAKARTFCWAPTTGSASSMPAVCWPRCRLATRRPISRRPPSRASPTPTASCMACRSRSKTWPCTTTPTWSRRRPPPWTK